MGPIKQNKSFRTQDNLILHYATYGTLTHKPTLFCLPGLTRFGTDFKRLAERYAHDRLVVTLDYRGRGKSQWCKSGKTYTPEYYINDARHLISLLGLKDIILVGTSLGAYLTVALATIIPTTVKGMILNEISPELDMGIMSVIGQFTTRQNDFRSWEEVFSYAETIRPLVQCSDEVWEKYVHSSYHETPQGTFSENWDARILSQFDPFVISGAYWWPRLELINAYPTLLVRGGLSTFLTPETFEKMQELLPHAQTCLVPDVGHAPSLNEPIAIEAVDHFIKCLVHSQKEREDILPSRHYHHQSTGS